MSFSVASIKDRLRIRADDTSKDQIISGIFSAVRRYVEGRTGLEVDAAEAARVDTFRNALSGKPLYLTRRPVGAIAAVESSVPSSTPTWTAVAYQLIDAQQGEIQLVGSGASSFPPEPGVSLAEKWRRSRYQLLRVTYSTLLIEPLAEDLELAMNDLAVFWYRRGQSSNLVSSAIGDLHELYNERAIPAHVEGMFVPYERKAVQWA